MTFFKTTGPELDELISHESEISQKFINKYSNLVERGCTFSSGLENTFDFDTVNTCRVSLIFRKLLTLTAKIHDYLRILTVSQQPLPTGVQNLQ